MDDGGPAAELRRHRHVGDGSADAWNRGEPRDERGADTSAFAQGDIVLGAHDLLACNDGRRRAIALERRMVPQRGLEHHAAGHDKHGRGE
ncbi:MAG: hypothetical protein ACJ76X_03555 [Solirubrobacteraceae bacterium]